jgi:ABC-type multidrug transport system ATPase subunit
MFYKYLGPFRHSECTLMSQLGLVTRGGARRDFWYEFYPGERLGVVGANGAGKSSMLRMVAGQLPLRAGERDLGETTQMGFFTQEPLDIPESMTMAAYLRWLTCARPCNAKALRWLRGLPARL